MTAVGQRSLSRSIEEFGAVGNDAVGSETANDLALVRAYTWLAARGGGELRVGVGTFRFTIIDWAVNNIRIVGEGRGASIFKTMRVHASNQVNAFHLVGSHLKLEGFQVKEGNPIATRRGRLYFNNGDLARIGGAVSAWEEDISVSDCLFDGGYTAGLDLYYANHVTASNNLVVNAFGNGLCAINCQYDVKLDQNTVENTTDDLIIVNTDSSVPDGTIDVTITKNRVKDGDAKGIATSGVNKGKIEGNTVKNTHTFGIAIFEDGFYALGSSSNVEAIGNTIEDAGQAYGPDWLVDTISTVPHAMRLDGESLSAIENTILNSAGRGIDSTNCDDLTVRGNKINGCAQTGIEIGDPSDSDYTRITDAVVTDNKVRNTVGGITVGSGTGYIVTDNYLRSFRADGSGGRRGIFYGYIKKSRITENEVINDDGADATILQYPGHACPDTTVVNNSELLGTDITSDTSGSFSLNGIKILSGSGSPEGAAAAPKGSLYLRTDGDFNSSVYIKMAFGGGNTGWRPPAQIAQIGDMSAITASADIDTAYKALTSTSVTPPDGAMAFDNTNHVLWVRMAGKWSKSSAFTVLS